MIQIDAVPGNGSDVLRAALGVSAACGVPVHVRGIRAQSTMPGLQSRDLPVVHALARICGAEIAGAALGSQEVTFSPGQIRSGDYRFDLETAGSISSLLHTILMPLAVADGPSRVTVTGGTHVPESSSVDFLREILFPHLARSAMDVRLEVVRWGFSPAGGGCVVVDVAGNAVLSPLTLVRRTGAVVVHGFAAAAGRCLDALERQRLRAVQRLRDAGYHAVIEMREVAASDAGRFLFLAAVSDEGRVGFSAVGDGDTSPEEVADTAVEAFLDFVRTEAACDPSLAEHLVVPLALANGTSRLTTSRVTAPLRATIAATQHLLGCPTQLRGEVGGMGSVTIEGVGARRHPVAVHASAPRNTQPRHDLPGVRADVPARIRKAKAVDGPAIQRLLARFASRGELLPRTLDDVYQHLRDFVVGEVDGRIVGVCALWLYWEDLAEVRSLAVDEQFGGRGLGTALVRACLAEAAGLGIRRVFALTYRPRFFERSGFRTLDKRELPQKIWKDCHRCAKFTCCDEVALIRDIEGQACAADG